MSEKDLFGFSPEEVELIRKTVGKEAVNEDELKRFLYRANKMGLNPLDGTIHLLTRNRKNDSGKWEKTNVIIVGIDGFRIAANRSGQLAGIKREAVYNDKGQLLKAIAEIYRKDWEHPAREVIPYREFCQVKEGRPVGLWSSMPETMLKKCAEAAALRMAFASELAGVYIPEEMQADEDTPTEKDAKKGGRKKASDTAETKGNNPPKQPEEPSTEPSKEAPKEPPKEAPSENPKEAPGEITKSEVGSFDGELIVLEPAQKREHPTFGEYHEIRVFDATAEKTHIMIGKNFSGLKPKDIIHVTGETKDDKIKPMTLEKITKKEPESKAAPEPDNAMAVMLTSKPTAARKTFDGKLEDVLWARAENNDGKYIIVARGASKDELSKADIDDTILVKGEVVSEVNGIFVYATKIEVSTEAVA